MIAYALPRFPPAHDRLIREADALANGTAIMRAPLSEFGEGYTVCRIEADAHEVVLANCAPAETFVDSARAAPSTASPNTRRSMETRRI